MLPFGLIIEGSPTAAGQVVVDGFNITVIKNPTKGVLPQPNPVSNGGVYYLVGGESYPPGVDPFQYIKKLAGVTPFLSIQPESTATFKFKNPVTNLAIFWGSIDADNEIKFLDSSMSQVGNTLIGADLIAAGVQGDVNLNINSGSPFSYVVLLDGPNCCFEFANVSGH
jgi:hypothetical protein